MDASENETTKSLYFAPDKWYHVRVRVTDGKIEIWLDRDLIINVPLENRTIAHALWRNLSLETAPASRVSNQRRHQKHPTSFGETMMEPRCRYFNFADLHSGAALVSGNVSKGTAG